MTKPYYSDWLLGSVFLRKFQFVFNQDSKTLGYYRYIPKSYDENNKNNLLDKKYSEIIKSVSPIIVALSDISCSKFSKLVLSLLQKFLLSSESLI